MKKPDSQKLVECLDQLINAGRVTTEAIHYYENDFTRAVAELKEKITARFRNALS